jgi:hypothetical protein
MVFSQIGLAVRLLGGILFILLRRRTALVCGGRLQLGGKPLGAFKSLLCPLFPWASSGLRYSRSLPAPACWKFWEDYIRGAVKKIDGKMVVYKHAFRNALIRRDHRRFADGRASGQGHRNRKCLQSAQAGASSSWPSGARFAGRQGELADRFLIVVINFRSIAV